MKGTTVTAVDEAPIGGALVRVHTLEGKGVWEASCQELGEHELDLVATSNSQGSFETESRIYHADCTTGCKRGVVCAFLDGFETIRIEFDDCDMRGPQFTGSEALVLKFEPERQAPASDADAGL